MEVILIMESRKVFKTFLTTHLKIVGEIDRLDRNMHEIEYATLKRKLNLNISEFKLKHDSILNNFTWIGEVSVKDFFKSGGCFDDLYKIKYILTLDSKSEICIEICNLVDSLMKKQFILSTKIKSFPTFILKLLDKEYPQNIIK